MGEVGALLNLTQAKGMSETDIRNVISPSPADRNRAALLTQYAMPSLDEWRFTNPIGAVLDMALHTIRSNHFKVDLSGLPGAIHCYHVHVYKHMRDGSISTEDCVAKEEFKTLTILLNSIRLKHKDWEKVGGKAVGFAYDGKSALFTSVRLPLVKQPDGSYVHTEDAALLNLDGTPGKKYQVL